MPIRKPNEVENLEALRKAKARVFEALVSEARRDNPTLYFHIQSLLAKAKKIEGITEEDNDKEVI